MQWTTNFFRKSIITAVHLARYMETQYLKPVGHLSTPPRSRRWLWGRSLSSVHCYMGSRMFWAAERWPNLMFEILSSAQKRGIHSYCQWILQWTLPTSPGAGCKVLLHVKFNNDKVDLTQSQRRLPFCFFAVICCLLTLLFLCTLWGRGTSLSVYSMLLNTWALFTWIWECMGTQRQQLFFLQLQLLCCSNHQCPGDNDWLRWTWKIFFKLLWTCRCCPLLCWIAESVIINKVSSQHDHTT